MSTQEFIVRALMAVGDWLFGVTTFPVPNWIVALPILTITVIKLLWSGDLLAAEGADGKLAFRQIILSGSFWLGLFFGNVALSLFGAVGMLLMLNPLETTPLWFAVAMVFAAVSSILAWWLLSMSLRQAKRESEGEP